MTGGAGDLFPAVGTFTRDGGAPPPYVWGEPVRTGANH